MNIQMQVCGLIIILLILYFYKRQETVGLYTEMLFRRAAYMCIGCLVLDILSVIFIMGRSMLPDLLVRGECKLYLASLVGTGYAALTYACADAFGLMQVNRFIKKMGIAAAAVSVILFLLPIGIYHEGRTVYTYGPACVATYIGVVLLIIATLVYTAKRGNRMNPRRRRAIRTWMGIWLAAAVVQFFNSGMLLVGYASALGIVILFFELENPEANLDRSTGFFNARAFTDYVKYKYDSKNKGCCLIISLENAHSSDIRIEHMEDILAEVTDFISRIPETKRFKTDEKEFSLAFESREQMERAYTIVGINTKLMPTQAKSGNEQADQMAAQMKMMNTMMPIMSAVFCFTLPAGMGIYWIAGAVIRSIQQVVINKHIDKMDFDYIIEKNKDKAAKKMEKKKVQTEKMQQYANISTRNIDINKKSNISDAEREAALKKANEYYSKNAKPGSMAAKANMVREYNEKNTRK